jgi:Protein of unknown function (DUF3800)
MRNIYVDESGINAEDPATIVVGLIVEPDRDWFPVLRRMRQLWDEHVPRQHREGFWFHAMQVSNGRKWSNWPEPKRRALLESIMRMPWEFEIPVSVGVVKRGNKWEGWPPDMRKKMTPKNSDHMMAFVLCVAQADEYVREHFEGEVAQVIAADSGEMRQVLKMAGNRLLNPEPLPLAMETYGPKGSTGRIEQVPQTTRRVIDDIHCLEPSNAPFLQLADACAFGLRRAFSNYKDGRDYLRIIAQADTAPTFPSDTSALRFLIENAHQIKVPPPLSR